MPNNDSDLLRFEPGKVVFREGDPGDAVYVVLDGKKRGIETRGVSDHGFIHSIYFRDPNGYVIELTVKTPGHDRAMDPAANGARAKLDRWQSVKMRAKKQATART